MRVGAFERLEAVVEIVVPKRRDRIVQTIHGGDDGVDRGRVGRDGLSRQVAERRALKDVAVVKQQAVGVLSARFSDQRRRAR